MVCGGQLGGAELERESAKGSATPPTLLVSVRPGRRSRAGMRDRHHRASARTTRESLIALPQHCFGGCVRLIHVRRSCRCGRHASSRSGQAQARAGLAPTPPDARHRRAEASSSGSVQDGRLPVTPTGAARLAPGPCRVVVRRGRTIPRVQQISPTWARRQCGQVFGTWLRLGHRVACTRSEHRREARTGST